MGGCLVGALSMIGGSRVKRPAVIVHAFATRIFDVTVLIFLAFLRRKVDFVFVPRLSCSGGSLVRRPTR